MIWIRYYPANHKNNQTTAGKDTQHYNIKARYISLFNHWKTFETTVNPFMTEAVGLLRKSMDWFLYDNGLRHERVKWNQITYLQS